MYDTIDVSDLRREADHRATRLQRDADHIRLRAQHRRGRSRLGSALRRTIEAVDGGRRAI